MECTNFARTKRFVFEASTQFVICWAEPDVRYANTQNAVSARSLACGLLTRPLRSGQQSDFQSLRTCAPGMRFEKLVTIVPLSRIDPDPAEITERVAQATL